MITYTAKLFEVDTLLRVAPRLLETFLVLMLAWSIAGLFTDTLPSDQRGGGSDLRSRVAESAHVDVAALANSVLFGKPLAKSIKPPVAKVEKNIEKPLVESRRPIKLKGTVVAGSRSAAFVFVGSSRKMEVFRLKESIQAGVTLEKVETDRILIKAGGALETVMLTVPGKGKPVGVRASGRKAASGRRASPPATRGSTGSGVLSRATIDGAINNLPKLMTQAQVLPHFQNGKSDGFVISRIAPNSLYADIGLQNNDIIKSVNGVSITSPNQAMAIYNSLRSANHLELTVKRGGRLQSLQLDIR
ncbi:MAG: type II secretion system protein N [Mariprofundaceae bacterium]